MVQHSVSTAPHAYNAALLFFDVHLSIYNTNSAMELGAGCGLCGIALAQLGCKQVVLTDTDKYIPLLVRAFFTLDNYNPSIEMFSIET
jgi:predicted RNA methylase